MIPHSTCSTKKDETVIYHVSASNMIYQIPKMIQDTKWDHHDIWWYIMIYYIEIDPFLYKKPKPWTPCQTFSHFRNFLKTEIESLKTNKRHRYAWGVTRDRRPSGVNTKQLPESKNFPPRVFTASCILARSLSSQVYWLDLTWLDLTWLDLTWLPK